MRLRKVSVGKLNQTFLRDGDEENKVATVANQEKNVEEMVEVAKVTNVVKVAKRGKSAEEQEEMNTTYSLADVSLNRLGLMRRTFCLITQPALCISF